MFGSRVAVLLARKSSHGCLASSASGIAGLLLVACSTTLRADSLPAPPADNANAPAVLSPAPAGGTPPSVAAPGGHNVRGFDPATATDEEIARRGLPPRPDPRKNPRAYERWRHMVSPNFKRIIPKTRTTNIYNGAVQKPAQ